MDVAVPKMSIPARKCTLLKVSEGMGTRWSIRLVITGGGAGVSVRNRKEKVEDFSFFLDSKNSSCFVCFALGTPDASRHIARDSHGSVRVRGRMAPSTPPLRTTKAMKPRFQRKGCLRPLHCPSQHHWSRPSRALQVPKTAAVTTRQRKKVVIDEKVH